MTDKKNTTKQEYTEEEVRDKIRLLVKNFPSQYKMADALGISAQYLYDVLKGQRSVGEKIPRKLGLQRKVLYTLIDNETKTKE